MSRRSIWQAWTVLAVGCQLSKMSLMSESVDGRNARRDRNKIAAVDAYLDLVHEGQPHPSVAEVSERSGVSHRSVFRYFADRDSMARASIERQMERVRPILERPVNGDASLEDRVKQVILTRIELYEVVGPVGHLSRSVASTQPIVREQLASARAKSRTNLKVVFAGELAKLESSAARDKLAILDVMLSFESIDLLRSDQTFSKVRTARVLSEAVRAMLLDCS
jgi:AcrR family transcriptional regulator